MYEEFQEEVTQLATYLKEKDLKKLEEAVAKLEAIQNIKRDIQKLEKRASDKKLKEAYKTILLQFERMIESGVSSTALVYSKRVEKYDYSLEARRVVASYHAKELFPKD